MAVPSRFVGIWQRIGERTPVGALSRGADRFLAVGDVAVLITPTGGRRWQRDTGTGPSAQRSVK